MKKRHPNPNNASWCCEKTRDHKHQKDKRRKQRKKEMTEINRRNHGY